MAETTPQKDPAGFVPATERRIRHTMLRVRDLEKSLDFYTRLMGMTVFRRIDNEAGKFSIAFVGYGSEETHAAIELTYNWGRDDGYEHGDGYGHIAVCVDDVRAEHHRFQEIGLNPNDVKEFHRDGALMARFFFVQDPDGYKIEVLERHGRYQ